MYTQWCMLKSRGRARRELPMLGREKEVGLVKRCLEGLVNGAHGGVLVFVAPASMLAVTSASVVLQ